MTENQINNRAERFWRWLYDLCAERIKAAYLERTGWDLKCPHCQSWSSLSGIDKHSWNDEQIRYTCGQCNTTTAWHFEGPVAWPVATDFFPNLNATL